MPKITIVETLDYDAVFVDGQLHGVGDTQDLIMFLIELLEQSGNQVKCEEADEAWTRKVGTDFPQDIKQWKLI